PEAAVLAELIPIEVLDEVEEGRVFDSERLRFGVVVKPLRDRGLRTDEHLKTVFLDVVDAPAHIGQGVRHFLRSTMDESCCPTARRSLKYGSLLGRKRRPRQNSFTAG